MGAAETLLKRGYRPQSAGTTSGELALWLSASDNPLIRDDDLKEAFGKALEHPSPYLRELALRRMPEGSSTDFVAAIANNIRSADPRVQVAACDLALRDKLSAVSPEVAAAFRTTTEAEGLRSCGSAFRQIAGRFEHVVVLAERIADPAMTPHGLDELIPLLEELNGGGYRPDPTAAEAAALSSRWLRFVRLHREDIEKERPIPLSDPSVSADLVPPGWYLFRNDKPNWPQR
jgi:hypothetical protein